MRSVILLLFAVLLHGQEKPARLTFEVASIKPSKPGGRGGAMKVLPGGQEFVAQNFPLRLMIARMHWVPLRQVTGGPDWMNTENWDIQAKADRPGYTREQMIEMLGNLLEDEFKLKLRKDVKEGPVYALSVDKSGLKMKVNDGPEDFEIPIQGGPGGVTVGKRVSMERLCFQLGQFVQEDERPVIDKTGLTGYLRFHPVVYAGAAAGFRQREICRPEMLNRPSLFDALKQQLGLKLEAQRGPVEYYVVENVVKPEN